MTEKEIIEKILRQRGIIDNEGNFNQTRFRKLATEPWVHTKTLKYGFDKLNGTQPVDKVEVVEAPIVEEAKVEEVVEQHVDTQEVTVEEPVEVVEAPVVEEPVEVVEAPVVEEAPAPKKKSTKKK